MTVTIPPELDPAITRLERLRYVQMQAAKGTSGLDETVAAMPAPPEEGALWTGWLALQSGNLDGAASILDKGLAERNDLAEVHYLRALVAQQIGDLAMAETHAQRASDLQDDYLECHIMLSTIRLKAPLYTEVLSRLHKKLAPECYLEIGLMHGKTLRLAKRAPTVIGVDPRPRIQGVLPPHFQVVKLTSDAFFASEAETLLAGTPVDFCFVDGLHEAGQALRDILNAEAVSRPGATIAVHDVIPLDAKTATPVEETMFWSGDVWKTWLALRKFCPDLDMMTVDAPPTGLGLIRRLNPNRNSSDADLEAMYSYMSALDFSDLNTPITDTAALEIAPWSRAMLNAFLSH